VRWSVWERENRKVEKRTQLTTEEKKPNEAHSLAKFELAQQTGNQI
jgi:hypothetical protein